MTPVSSPTNNTTPIFVFSSNESGQIAYGGSCTSSASSAVSGVNSITFNSLSDGTYSNCTITVTDSSGNTATINVNTFNLDTTGPGLTLVTPVSSPTNNTTPVFVFSSNESGQITYGGSCTSSASSAVSGNNSITFNTLSEGYYNNCTINVTDAIGNISNTLVVYPFSVGAIILFNQTANFHINDYTPTKSKGDFASSNVCHISAQSLGLTDYTIGFFASVSSNLKLFVTGENTSLPVVSFNNSLISNTWDELWDGAIDMSLRSAGVVSSNNYWSGTLGDGSKVTPINYNSAGNCNNFTSSSGWDGGAIGSSNATSQISGASGFGSLLAESLRPSWVAEYPDVGCSDEYEIVCVAKPN